jgi:hypothetical protein
LINIYRVSDNPGGIFYSAGELERIRGICAGMIVRPIWAGAEAIEFALFKWHRIDLRFRR